MIEVEVTNKYLREFLSNIRQEDKLEIDFSKHECFEKELFDVCFDKTYDTYFLSTNDGKPLVLGGAYLVNNSKTARVWLLATDYLESEKKSVYGYVKNKIELFKDKYDILYNFIYKTNFNSLKWLKKCGFKVFDLKDSNFKLFYFCKEDIKFDIRYFTSQ